MLSVARTIPQFDSKMRRGDWEYSVGVGLDRKTLGIIGLGAIGKEVAERAKGFSMDILAYDPFFNEEFAEKKGIQKASLDEIYEKSDFITLHLPVTNQTEGMINAEVFRKMKNSAILINAARGQLINETDLYNALKNSDIGGAGLDVYEKEPLTESPLFELDNIVICPHIGAATVDSLKMMGQDSIENTMNILNGRNCNSILNRKYLAS